jgi:hypothetical protein
VPCTGEAQDDRVVGADPVGVLRGHRRRRHARRLQDVARASRHRREAPARRRHRHPRRRRQSVRARRARHGVAQDGARREVRILR